MEIIIYAMVFLGSALMVFNIYGFVIFGRKVKTVEKGLSGKRNLIVNIPVVLLILFLLGYLAVGIFGKPDLIVSGILFGGSIFVFVMYLMLDHIIKRLSESKETEAKLLATEESNRAKSEFLSDMSHEMRTPLNIILGLCTMALKDTSIAEETRDRLEKIVSNANYLLGLINNILDINSIDSGEFSVKNEEFSVSEIVSQTDIIARLLCKEKEMTYTSCVSESADGLFSGDDMRFKQIILSLLDNVIKNSGCPGSLEFDVSCKSGKNDTLLCFTLKDTCASMNPDFWSALFDPSVKGNDKVEGHYTGNGLDLSATKKLVTILGGTIDAKIEKSGEYVFTVSLPVTRVQDDDALYESISLEGKRILIVEDIAANAEIVADLLELEGAESEYAENGSIGVDMFRTNAPGYYDAILMDLRMPVMDGLTAAREIRKTERDDAGIVPIIALTANALESDVKESLNAGMNMHLAKPTDSDKLFASLKKVIYESEKKARN